MTGGVLAVTSAPNSAAGHIYEIAIVGQADIDDRCVSLGRQDQGLVGIIWNGAAEGEIVGRAQGHDGQGGPGGGRGLKQAVDHFIWRRRIQKCIHGSQAKLALTGPGPGSCNKYCQLTA